MYNLMGYLFMLVLILSLGTFFAISIQCDYKRIKKRAEREIKKLDILNQMIQLKEQITAKSAKHLKKGTFEHLYLSQIDAVLQHNPFQLDKKRVTPMNFKKRDDGIDKETFIKSYQKAPICVKQDMESASEMLGRIYQIQHPTKYKIMQVKKIMTLQILKMLIDFCSFMIKHLEKRCEINAKNRITKFKKRQQKAQSTPSSMLLNIHSDSSKDLLQLA